jgi:hypothetical protein
MATQKKGADVGVVVGVAAGIAAVAAAGYFLFGPNGKNNRKVIKGWTVKMKGEVLEKIEKLKEITPEMYDAIIDEVAGKYAKLKHVNEEEIKIVTADLKKYWKVISRDVKAKQGGAKKKVTQAKKVATKVVKKAVKKAAKTVAKEATKVAENI